VNSWRSVLVHMHNGGPGAVVTSRGEPGRTRGCVRSGARRSVPPLARKRESVAGRRRREGARNTRHGPPTGWGPPPALARLRRWRGGAGLAWSGVAHASRLPGRLRPRSVPRRSTGAGRRGAVAAWPSGTGNGRGTVRRRRGHRAGVPEDTEAAGREIRENRGTFPSVEAFPDQRAHTTGDARRPVPPETVPDDHALILRGAAAPPGPFRAAVPRGGERGRDRAGRRARR
jgi:hypothetical protein